MPPQTPVQTRTRDLRVEELPDHGEQIVERDQQRLAQNDRDRLLRGRKCRLQPVRRMAAVMNVVAMPPFADGLLVCRENESLDRFLILQTPEPFRQHRRRRVAGLDRRPDFWRRRCLLVKMDQHARTPFLMSRRTDLAMKNADRRGSM